MKRELVQVPRSLSAFLGRYFKDWIGEIRQIWRMPSLFFDYQQTETTTEPTGFMDNIRILKRFLPLLKSHILYMAVGAFLVLLGMGARTYQPLLSKRIFDEVLPEGNLQLLVKVAGLQLGLALAGLGLSLLSSYLFLLSQTRFIIEWRTKVMEHLMQLGPRFLSTRPQGYLSARVLNDTGSVRGIMASNIVDFIASIVELGVIMVICMKLSPLLTVMVFPITILTVFYNGLIAKPIRRRNEILVEAKAQVHSQVGQIIDGLSTLVPSSEEHYLLQRLRDFLDRARRAELRASLVSGLSGAGGGIIASIGPLLVIALGATLIIRGGFSVGGFLAFLMYFQRIMGLSRNLLDRNINLQDTFIAIKRVFEILDSVPEVCSSPRAKVLPPEPVSVAFNKVCFGYQPEEPVLKDISLSIESGSCAALVGVSGGGKSTLAALIPRLYDVWSGNVLVGGMDVRELELYSLRSKVGYVPQDPFLFNASIAENVALFNPDASQDCVLECLEIAQLGKLISELPNGMDTVVGNRGMKLSSGQRQRIALARELFHQPEILILDEATSAVDSESEAAIREALRWLIGRKTLLIIAHRLSTVASADCIFVLHDGRIVEVGTHSELLRLKNVYHRIFREQCHRGIESEGVVSEVV